MDKKIITVIMPLYNAEATVKMALDSIKNQTVIETIREVIIVNDGSTDSSTKCVEEFGQKNKDITVTLVEQENAGASAARNRGIELAKTKYIAFLDADDIWFPQKIEKQLEVLEKYPHIRFLGTAWEEKEFRIGLKKITKLYKGTVKDICIKNFPVTPSVLMERALLDEIGVFNAGRKFAEDINLFQRVAAIGELYFMPEQLVKIDIGKDFFGEKGLSSHLKEMHEGTLYNIKELRQDGIISDSFWLLMRCFYEVKYIRRKVIRLRYSIKRKKNGK